MLSKKTFKTQKTWQHMLYNVDLSCKFFGQYWVIQCILFNWKFKKINNLTSLINGGTMYICPFILFKKKSLYSFQEKKSFLPAVFQVINESNIITIRFRISPSSDILKLFVCILGFACKWKQALKIGRDREHMTFFHFF